MPKCKYCGKFAGLFDNEHLDCAQAAQQGTTVALIEAETAAVHVVPPLTVGSIVSGVFWGLWLWTLSVAFLGLLWWFVRQIL
jgi:hypothetical protein